MYIKDIKSLEQKINLSTLTVDNEPIWPVLRIYYFFKMRDHQVTNVTTSKQQWKNRILQRLYGLHRGWFTFLKSFFLFRNQILCFSDSHELKIIEGKSQNKLFFSLFSKIGVDKFLYFERPVNPKYFGQASSDPKSVSTSLLDLIALVGSYFVGADKIENEDTLNMAEELIGFKLDYNRYLRQLKSYRILACILFKVYKPKFVFISEYYNLFYMAICYEAARVGIPTIEFQHGIINDEHPAYNFYNSKIVSNYLPKYFASFGQKFIDSLGSRSFIPVENMIVVGHSYLTFIKNDKNKIDFSNSVKKWKSKFLVTLQWTDQKQVINYICTIAPLCKDSIFILLPRVWDADIHVHAGLPENVYYDNANDFYKLIKVADVHVTTYSTTALEAAVFNVPNILLNFDNMAKTYFSDFLKASDWDQFVETKDEFLAACKKIDNLDIKNPISDRNVIMDEDLGSLLNLIEIKNFKKSP